MGPPNEHSMLTLPYSHDKSCSTGKKGTETEPCRYNFTVDTAGYGRGRLEIVNERIVADDASAATVYLATATRRTGETTTIKVVACYEIRDGKIVLIDALSRVVHGREGDHKLESIQS